MTRHALILAALLALALPGAAHSTDLTGRVVDVGGAPVARATVSASFGGSTLRTATTDDGTFVLALPDGAVAGLVVTIAAAGFEPMSIELEEPVEELSVTLQPKLVFSGVVEVTGTRATVGETPVTITNIGREEIERGSWGQDVPMFLSQVPGFYAYNDNGHGIGYSYFTLRGFDMRRTSVTLNGVPLNDAHSHSVFFIDLADFLATTGDIQVQRGVGTSLYGGSAIGGSLDIRTRHPLTEPRLRLSAMGGSWGTRRFSLEYDSGLVEDEWAFTFRYSKIDTDGYRDQSWVKMWNYFATLEHYGERSTTRIMLFGGPEETHLAYEGVTRAYLDGEITGDRRRDRRHNPLTFPGEIDSFFQPHYQLLHSWDIDDRLALHNTVYFFEGDGYFSQYKESRWFPEYDLEPFEGPDGEVVDTTDLVRRRNVTEWDAGWIPRLEWSHGSGRGRLQAGAAIRLHDGRHYGQVRWAEHWPPDLPPDHRYYDYRLGKRTLQPFVQEEWRLDESWMLLGGLTWTHHRYDMDEDQRNGVELTQSYSFLLPRMGVMWQPAPDWSIFANVSRGAREPAFRDIYDPQDYWAQVTALEEEEVVDYELGGEHRWRTGYARLNLYWLDFTNEIVWAGGLDDNGVPINANAAASTHRGVELEVGLNPRPRWGAHLSVAYSRRIFDEFLEYDWDGNAIDYSGNRIGGHPDLLATLQLQGGVGPVDALLTIRRVGRFYLDNTEDMRKDPEARQEPGYVHRVNDAFTTLDLSLQVDLGRPIADLARARMVRLDLRLNNLMDALYTTYGYVWPEPVWIPAATRSAYVGLTMDW